MQRKAEIKGSWQGLYIALSKSTSQIAGWNEEVAFEKSYTVGKHIGNAFSHLNYREASIKEGGDQVSQGENLKDEGEISAARAVIRGAQQKVDQAGLR